MGTGRASWIALLGLAVGCAGSTAGYRAEVTRVLAPRPPVRIAAPTATVPRPWEIGQWALYRTRQDGDTAFQWLGVVAKDSCGTWVRSIEQSVKQEFIFTACVRPDASGRLRVAYVINERDGKMATVDFRREPQVMPLLGFVPAWTTTENLTGEAIDVAAGHFEGAIRVGAALVHPAVPFAGWLKTRALDGAELELVAFGASDTSSIVPNLAVRAAAATSLWGHRAYVSLGTGIAKPLGHGRDATNATLDLRLRPGARITPRLGVYGELTVTGSQRYKPDPTQLQSSAVGELGVQWKLGDVMRTELYLRGGLGLGTVSRAPMTGDATSDYGLAASLGVGLFLPVAGVAGLNLEVVDDTITTGDGMRHYLGVQMSLQIPFLIPFR